MFTDHPESYEIKGMIVRKRECWIRILSEYGLKSPWILWNNENDSEKERVLNQDSLCKWFKITLNLIRERER
jgi:hypothetical protein